MPARRRSYFLALSAGCVLLAVVLYWWMRGESPEGAQPDHFELGTVFVGAKVKFSAQLLTSPRTKSFDAFYERTVRRMPASWQPKLWEWHPRNRRIKLFVSTDLTTLKPSITAPPFVRVVKAVPDQNKNWYQGRPFVLADMELDTSLAGEHSGAVTVMMGERRASLPVRVTIREMPPGIPRLLIVSTPYQANATESGSDFHVITRLLSSSGMAADYLNELPAALENYRTIILADSALSDINARDVERMRSFVTNGGRFILPCNYFFRGTVSQANLILAGHGLQVVDLDIAGQVSVTNLVSDPLTLGLARLEFHRPSPIQVTDATQGKLLALDPAGQGGFVGVARLPGGGEIVVLASSLWWHWVSQFKDNSDNARLLQNALRLPNVP